jgi:hypothetical protein
LETDVLLLKLSDTQAEDLDERPEAAMGLHFAEADNRLGLILSGHVLMFPYEDGNESSNYLADKLWFNRDRNMDEEAESKLLKNLDHAPAKVTYIPPAHPWVLGFILSPPGYLPPPPRRPAYIYGHLPFDGTTQTRDVFYRCEHWLTSRRVLRATGDILAGTYGFPESELRFVPTGFAAVGRYALPDLPPACRQYEIRPPSGYKLRCGAAIPLYGQAGGGVEVMFPKRFTNSVVPIPHPTVLPPL